MRSAVVVGLVLVLGGCHAAMKAEMRSSLRSYKQCLAEKPATACENERLAYEADAQAVEAAKPRGGGFMYVVPTK